MQKIKYFSYQYTPIKGVLPPIVMVLFWEISWNCVILTAWCDWTVLKPTIDLCFSSWKLLGMERVVNVFCDVWIRSHSANT